MVNQPYCIDIYQGDDVVGDEDQGFEQVKALGIAFLDHKVSQGTDEFDRRCAFRREKWMDGAPIIVTDVNGATLSITPRFSFYHFNGVGSAADESAHFMDAAKKAGYQLGDDLCLDWEDIGASGVQRPAAWADEFCERVEQWCGFHLKVYGGDAPRQQLLHATSTMSDRFAVRRLWFCQYGPFSPNVVPLPWREAGPYMWQDDGDASGPGIHKIPGILSNCDNSTVVGDMTVIKLLAGWGGAGAAA
jgi:hypothetical protein